MDSQVPLGSGMGHAAPRRPKGRKNVPLGVIIAGVVLLAVLVFCGLVLVKMGSPAVQQDVTVELV